MEGGEVGLLERAWARQIRIMSTINTTIAIGDNSAGMELRGTNKKIVGKRMCGNGFWLVKDWR